MTERTRVLEKDAPLPEKRDGIESENFGKELVLYDEGAKRVHVLNRSARLIWDSCNGQTTVNALLAQMLRVFSGASEERLIEDIDKTVERFAREGLLHGGAER